MITIEAPATLKPSQILRRLDEQQRCRHRLREEWPDGTIKVCALGALGEAVGFDWGEESGRECGWDRTNHLTPFWKPRVRYWAGFLRHQEIADLWGLTAIEVDLLVMASDQAGFAAAAQYLESIGK